MNTYKSQYIDLKFERAGLFEAIRDKYRCKDVLSPGCSVHITPSLYFPHVVYLDQSEDAAQFFADEKSLLEFVNRRKHYRQSAYIRFMRQDYSRSLPLMEGKFDLLLALFAGGIARSCCAYLRAGGILLTNNHQGDAVDAVNDRRMELAGVVRFRRGTYSVIEGRVEKIKISAQKSHGKFLRQVNEGAEYLENEEYYVFQRLR